MREQAASVFLLVHCFVECQTLFCVRTTRVFDVCRTPCVSCMPALDNSACDNLRCTDCNFAVLRFDGRAWEGRTDYLFLRNNAPDPAKLSARLQPCAGMQIPVLPSWVNASCQS